MIKRIRGRAKIYAVGQALKATVALTFLVLQTITSTGCGSNVPTFDAQTRQLLQNILDTSLATIGVPGGGR